MARRKKRRISSDLVEESRRKFVNVASDIDDVPADEWLKSNFLPYAWDYNLDRALVDVSGLKPVQRRILYTMWKKNLNPNANRMKVATLAGAVLAYHPHGDASVSEALKNMARAHIFRVPLIDGKGDFGTIGSPGAAPRYIEARLSKAAWLNVEEIDQNAVKIIPNYDGKEVEPERLPVRWPVGVINGNSGMAVGYAANMPSHNPTEVMKACIALVKNPDLSDNRLANIVKGPDFNMGGFITSTDGVKEYLKTGSGTFTIRSKYDVTPIRGGGYRIDYYEIPFGTTPEAIKKTIKKQMDNGHLKDVVNVNDLSDLKHPVKFVVDVKKDAQIKSVIEDLFRRTPLESKFSANMTTVVNNRPQQSSMKDLLLDFIEFRKQCIVNKLGWERGKRCDRLHLVRGLLSVLLDIDKAVRIIRNSDDAKTASTSLQKTFKIDEVQANYVLSLQLRRLTKMDRHSLDEEEKSLTDRISEIDSILKDGMVEYMVNEFKETMKVIGDDRKTEINDMTEAEYLESRKNESKVLKAEDKGAKTCLYVLADGRFLKSMEPIDSVSMARTNRTKKVQPYLSMVRTAGNENVSVIGDDGVAYSTALVSMAGNEPVSSSSLSTIPSGVHVVNAVANNATLLAVTRNGKLRAVKLEGNDRWDDTPVLALGKDDQLVAALDLSNAIKGTTVILITDNGHVLRTAVDSIRPVRAGSQGIAGMRLGKGVHVAAAVLARPDSTNLYTASKMTVKVTPISEITIQGRGGGGVKCHPVIAPDHVVQAVVDGGLVTNRGRIMDDPTVTRRAARPEPLKSGAVLAD